VLFDEYLLLLAWQDFFPLIPSSVGKSGFNHGKADSVAVQDTVLKK
jgi:hypothetical protein